MKHLLYVATLILLLFACRPDSPQSRNPLQLLAPPDGQMQGLGSPIYLSWSSPPLAENQLYSLRIAPKGAAWQDILWTAESFYELPADNQLAGTMQWQISIVQLDENGTFQQTLFDSHVGTFQIPSRAGDLFATFDRELPAQTQACSIPPLPNAPIPKDFMEYDVDGTYESLDAEGLLHNSTLAFGRQKFPLFMATYAYAALLEWCENLDEMGLKIALYYADWFMEQGFYGDEFVVWRYDFPHGEFSSAGGWASGLASAEILKFFSELYQTVPDPTYQKLMQQIVHSFAVPVAEGGIQALLPDGKHLFFEEVAANPSGHILNGHMTVILELLRYAERYGDEEARQLAEAGIDSVKAYLPVFDVETVSLYALGIGSAVTSNREHYAHPLHIQQLYQLYRHTHDSEFLRYAFRWIHDLRSPYGTQLYLNQVDPSTAESTSLEHMNIRTGYDVDTLATQALIWDLGEVKPLGSWSYGVLSPSYPTAYTLAVSVDGVNWETVAEVADYDQNKGVYRFEGLETRYFKLEWSAWSRPDQWIKWGLTRLDTPDYWTQAILCMGNTTLQFMGDLRPDTPLQVQAGDQIYLDRQMLGRGRLVLTTDAIPPNSQVRVEFSTDLAQWQALEQDFTVAKTTSLDLGSVAWRYLRLTVTGETFHLSELQIIP